jgi:hypothetical protein
MTDQPRSIREIFKDGRLIDEALRRGVQEALRFHKRMGHSVAAWRDGRVVVIAAEDIEVDDEDSPDVPPRS